MEPLGGTRPYPTKTGNENTAVVDGDREILHSKLEGAFGGGNGVRDRKIFTGKEIVEMKTAFCGFGMKKRADFAAKDELIWLQDIQDPGKWNG